MGLSKLGAVPWLQGLLFLCSLCMADVHYYDFYVRESNFTKLCNTKPMLVVNDSYPGPEIRVRRGDTVFVNVHNQGSYGFTIHWHGVKQPRNPWSDGPEFVTQCPIQPGTNFTYEVILSDEIGTLWWHAHSDWTRGSVHGAFIILPAEHETYPFHLPRAEQTIILESWYNGDYLQLLRDSNLTGLAVPPPDAYAFNGHLGDTTNCNDSIFRMDVNHRETYLLRIINAAMNEEKFFSIANHTLIVVAQDASYVQRFATDYIMITPGQTMDVLVHANQNIGQYYMVMRNFHDSAAGSNNNITTGVFRNTRVKQNPSLKVPRHVNRRVYIAISTSSINCTNPECLAVSPTRFVAAMNDVIFRAPRTDILQAYYNRSINGVFTKDFPLEPPEFYNFTGQLGGINPNVGMGTRAVLLNYGEAVEIVFQATQFGAAGSHPLHLHGFSFYRVGSGSGNFNNVTDPKSYNLVDPPLINTVHVPARGWVALRFFANNPGVWFMHCHFERHSTWGMDTVFIVKNGATAETSIRPLPASGMPVCSGA
ncbi:hypothetical protein V6N12_051779 [Hibiscus sabdariffa]|uniref:laccase n=1 Tax=Hibiscus sabdariffa TaxID=183260 RepID=A0ABR2GGB5_9ROSI